MDESVGGEAHLDRLQPELRPAGLTSRGPAGALLGVWGASGLSWGSLSNDESHGPCHASEGTS